ncbi:group II intron reverse transcriptase/maturase [Arenibacter latericius]|uniref:group II intron reverse transcriptase/maturase n=1 Tax=Arenibacter latericius TaxID=86104 RepID=UPI00047C58CD|nr:group II intron reverse transcriptase/maturase [Arenibacter latericius]
MFDESKTSKQKNRTEPEGYVGGQTFMWITENNRINDPNETGYDLLERILSPSNLNSAYHKVKRNNGVGGVDKMEVESLGGYLAQHKDSLINNILDGKYRPNAVRRVEIPKDDGEKRNLGIPTLVDRVIQQAISQELSKLYESQFSLHSYGFRPKRNAHQALKKCQKYITDGYDYAVDMDLEKFFDTVNHSKLIELLSRTVKDNRVVSLIHRYLNAGVQVGQTFEPSKEGVPQGGPLSPLLSNIMLNELDRELEDRGHKFVRYADDFLILCKSKRSSERVMESIINFIENELYLKVNREKSQVASIRRVKFLGYSFYKLRGGCRLRVHPKSIAKMKAKLKELTSRSNGWGNERRKESLSQYIRGWVNYFKLADMKKILLRIDEWYRRRLRMVIWKQWKRIGTKITNLVKLGVKKSKAYKWANTRKAYWHTSKSFILSTTITKKRLQVSGYVFLSDYYLKVRIVN